MKRELFYGEKDEPFLTSRPFGIMGILNLSPDSFYDSGRLASNIRGAAENMLRDGADILDLGGESTRPGATPTAASAELARVVPAIREIVGAFPDARISVDTWKAEIAAAALAEGAAFINDVSGLRDPAMPDVLAQYKPSYCLTRNTGLAGGKGPRSDDIISDAKGFFESRMGELERRGFPENHIVLDCGIGFGKSFQDNLALLARMGEFLDLGRPLLVGVSMKSFFGDLLGLELRDRASATAVATALLWREGVFWHRVHDVRAARDALVLAVALRGN